jgi:hypothetical protein
MMVNDSVAMCSVDKKDESEMCYVAGFGILMLST